MLGGRDCKEAVPTYLIASVSQALQLPQTFLLVIFLANGNLD